MHRPFSLLAAIALLAPISQAVPLRGPIAMDLSDDGRYALIAMRKDDTVARVDLQQPPPYPVLDIAGVGDRPVAIRVAGPQAIVVHEFDRHLTLIDIATATVTGTVPVPLYCQDVIWDAGRSRYYVSNLWLDQILVFDAGWQAAGAVAVGRQPGPMTIGPGGRLYVGNRASWDVSIVDLDQLAEVGRVAIGSRPEGLASTAEAVLVTHHGGDELTRLGGVPIILDDQVDIRNVVTEIAPSTLATGELWIDRGGDYLGIESAAGLVAFVAGATGTLHVHELGGELQTVDPLVGETLPGGLVSSGSRIRVNLRDVAIRDATQVFALAHLRDSLIEFRRIAGVWQVFGETPLNPVGRPITAFQSFPGAVNFTRTQNGERYFHTVAAWSRGQQDFSCATCHTDGHTDHRLIFDFKIDPHDEDQLQGPELHPSARLSRFTAPFAYEGDKETLFDINVAALDAHDLPPQGGFVALDTAQFMVLYEQSLVPGPNPYAGFDVTAGRDLFFATAGCAGCHGGDFFTDNGLHDVGTGRVINTPSLIGLWDRGAYLHDARAPTLEAVLDPTIYGAGAESHGNLATLTAGEVQSLAGFLRSLEIPPLFVDGFESGSLSAWSGSVP